MERGTLCRLLPRIASMVHRPKARPSAVREGVRETPNAEVRTPSDQTEAFQVSPNGEVRTTNSQTRAVHELGAGLLFFAVAGDEALTTKVIVAAVRPPFDDVSLGRCFAYLPFPRDRDGFAGFGSCT